MAEAQAIQDTNDDPPKVETAPIIRKPLACN